jgi:hypothetical protein
MNILIRLDSGEKGKDDFNRDRNESDEEHETILIIRETCVRDRVINGVLCSVFGL